MLVITAAESFDNNCSFDVRLLHCSRVKNEAQHWKRLSSDVRDVRDQESERARVKIEREQKPPGRDLFAFFFS